MSAAPRQKDEGVLLTQAKAGDLLARQQLLLRQHRCLMDLIRAEFSNRLRSSLDPEDVLHDVYTQILGAFDLFTGESPETFRKWAQAIARNRIRVLHRRYLSPGRQAVGSLSPTQVGRFSLTTKDLVSALEAHMTTVSGRAVRIEALESLAAALALLPEHYRQVIELRYLQGFSVDETAARTGRTKGSVLMIAQRAMRQIAGTIKRFPLLTRN